MIYLPIIGALAMSVKAILEKIGLRKRGIKPNHLIVALFFGAVVIMIPFLPFFAQISHQALELKNIWLLALIVFFAILANICYFYAMKREKLTNLEPVHLLQPLFVIVLASAFFASERNPNVLIPAIIASIALLFSHVKKHHLEFNKYILIAILGSLFYAIETLFTKIILEFYSPLSLYFVRGFFVLLFVAVIFRPNLLKEIKKKNRWIIVAISFLWVGFAVLSYYGFIQLGVVFTTLLLMLSPVFIYLFSWKFLKEKLDWRNIIAAIVIVASVLYAIFI